MMLIDTHSHIYLPEFESDLPAVLAKAGEEGVKKIYLPAIDSSTHTLMLNTEAAYPENCLAMMGLHPCSVKENYKSELAIINDYLRQRNFCAIGEIGLDFYWDVSFKEQQYSAFHTQVQWALEYDLPIAIHSRESLDECIEVVRQHQNGKLRGVFHCFSGNAEQAKRITDLGFYLGIGGVVTFKNAGLDKVMETVEMDFVVLETDAPYLAPVPFRGKRNEPSYLKYIVEKIAGIKNISKEEVAAITTANADKLFIHKVFK